MTAQTETTDRVFVYRPALDGTPELIDECRRGSLGAYRAYAGNRAFVDAALGAGNPACSAWDGNPLVFSPYALNSAGERASE